MGTDIKSLGAEARGDLLLFDPEKLVLVTDKSHALYDERIELPLDELTIRDIMARGVIEPVVVRRNGMSDGVAIHEVVDGRQRVRHAREANRRLVETGRIPVRVPAIRASGSDSDLLGVMIAANEHRTADGPMVLARKLQRYLSTGRTEQEAAVTFRRSEATIKNWAALLECTPHVQLLVERGSMPAAAAVKISRLPREEQNLRAKEMIESGATKGEKGKAAAEKGTGRVRLRSMRTKAEIAKVRDICASKEWAAATAADTILSWVIGETDLPSRLKKAVEAGEAAE
jgi:ParB family chromosome partitioning protein